MSESSMFLKNLHLHLLLLSPYNAFKKLVDLDQFSKDESIKVLLEPVSLILKGYSGRLLELPVFTEELITKQSTNVIADKYKKSGDINLALKFFVKVVFDNYAQLSELQARYSAGIFQSLVLLYAIALGQCFIQLNFTGPSIDGLNPVQKFFGVEEADKKLSLDIVQALDLHGLSTYELSEEPILLALSLQFLEKLTKVSDKEWSLLNTRELQSTESIAEHTESQLKEFFANVGKNDHAVSLTLAMAYWWRSRFLQVQMSLFSETSSVISSICSILQDAKIIALITTDSINSEEKELVRLLHISYFLENARNSIHGELESLAISALDKARKLSDLKLVLTGAKAKRTRYQEKSIASLIVLAKSNVEFLPNDDTESSTDKDDTIETKELNSDLLLEVPQYDSINDEAVNEIMENDDFQNGKSIKRIKLSFDNYEEEEPKSEEEKKSREQRLLPIAIKSENIPESLKELDPNEQPRLNDLDSVQLFLRLKTLKQVSPVGSHLVEEELMALVSRIIANNSDAVRKEKKLPAMNWLSFSKSLWERSLIESNKAKTIERGIFQMQALVEELNSKIQTRLFGQLKKEDKNAEICASATRLRYINQLPLSPRWSLDAELAEKYMSIGVLKSAVEIYERLQMIPEMAVCYASVGQEEQAEKVLRKRLESHPRDSRSLSILGDITQDPALWEKAWEINKYQNAKVSLAKYFYSKKKNTAKNLDIAVKHMNEVLTINPLNFQNWYFYGCLGMESEQFELAAEAFTRCVALDDAHTHSWSNLGGALLNTGKAKEALSAFRNAIKTSDTANWRIWENFLITAAKVGDWVQVIRASKMLIDIKQDETVINLKIVEALISELTGEEYPIKSGEDADESQKLSFFQRSCVDYICNQLPKVNTKYSVLWRLQAKVELWRNKPWNSLNCMEKAYRVDVNNENLISDEKAWNTAVDSCIDLVASYESLGEMPGKYGAGDLVCKDWKFKARSSIRTLMGKGKISWEGSEGWEKLVDAKNDL